MKLRTLNIIKANSELERLEKEQATLTEQVKALTEQVKAAGGSKEEVEALTKSSEESAQALETANSERIAALERATKAEADIATIKASLASVTSELTAAKATIADPTGEIAKRSEAAASIKAREIASAQGIPITQLSGGTDAKTATPAELRAEYHRLTKSGDAMAAGKFYEKHRKEILQALDA